MPSPQIARKMSFSKKFSAHRDLLYWFWMFISTEKAGAGHRKPRVTVARTRVTERKDLSSFPFRLCWKDHGPDTPAWSHQG